MPFQLNTTTIPLPALPKNGRSALQQLRRMFFLRWSAGKYLTTIGRNHGVDRPSLGFSDDDFYRACLQVLANDRKAIRGAFVYLIENVLGPHEDMFFELDRAHVIGESYLQYRPYGDYVPYENWNATAFTIGERIEATHPVTGLRTIALIKEFDAALSRIFFTDQYRSPDAGGFDVGHSLTGRSSGGKVDITGHEVSRDFEDFPLFGTLTIDPGGGNEEAVRFVCPDPYIGRIRIIDDLTIAHLEGEKIKVDGNCWDFIETKARRIVVRVRCQDKIAPTLRGNAYLHPSPALEPRLRTTVIAGATEMLFDETIMEDLVGFSFPQDVLMNPGDEHIPPNPRQFVASASAYDQTARKLTLASPLAAGVKLIKGTKVRLYHAKSGELLDNALLGATSIVARCRWEYPYGVWALDLGGGSEEKVFVTGSSYQKRLLTSEIVPTTTEIWLNRPLDNLDLSHAAKLVVSDETGVLGELTISLLAALQPDPRKVILLGAAGFSTDLASKETVVEYCRGSADLGVTVYLANPLAAGKTAPLDMVQVLGTTATQPTFADHLVNAGWPGVVATPDGRWPGPYIWEPSARVPTNTQATGKAEVEIDRTEPNDVRIYITRTTLKIKHIPGSAAILPFRSYNATNYIPQEVYVADGSEFPPDSAIQNWLINGAINPSGEPMRIAVSAEGTFGRTPLYLWGRVGDTLHVSGISRTHLPGVPVSTFTFDLPILASVASLFGGSPGLDLAEGTVILDHGTQFQEDVDYDGLTTPTPTRGLLTFTRGFSPLKSHNPYRPDPYVTAGILGVPVIRGDKLGHPRRDGFSFPFYLNGGMSLYRLRFLMDMVRAAGTKVIFVDQFDKEIPL